MKISPRTSMFLAAMLAFSAGPVFAQTRMQVSAGSAAVFTQPSSGSQQVGTANAGEILFVARIEGDWAAISPLDRFDLWLNQDFIEGNRVLANNLPVRAGPGVQYDVVCTLARGAPVMPRGESGDWRKIAPPSSAILWVRKQDLSDVRAAAAPLPPVAAPVAAAQPAPVEPVAAKPAPVAAPKPAPAATVASKPARAPVAATPKPAAPPAPVRVASSTPAPAPARKPATALPAGTAPRAAASPAAPAKPPAARRPAAPAVAPVPASASAGASQKSKHVDVAVDPTLVDSLVLAEDTPNQGHPVQVEGQLRNAPFLAASPSRYRLLDRSDNGVLEMVCHVHGDSADLRPYVGQVVSIRGREYWVETSDMPVVVVGQIVPLAPASEPVMY